MAEKKKKKGYMELLSEVSERTFMATDLYATADNLHDLILKIYLDELRPMTIEMLTVILDDLTTIIWNAKEGRELDKLKIEELKGLIDLWYFRYRTQRISKKVFS